jgi:hypothetical protein
MLFPAHALLGLLILRIAIELNPEYYSKSVFFIIFSIIAALLPDLDALGKGKLKDHHKSLFHAPFFWGVIFMIFLEIHLALALLFGAQIFAHLLLDYITARTAGIALFYPYSIKEFSVIPLRPLNGNFHLLELRKLERYLKFYFKNRLLTAIEISICILGIIAIII